MGNDDDEKKPPAMRRPRPSEIRRHGFGSPQGMEMTDIPSRRSAATEPESTTEEIFDPFNLSTSVESPTSPSPLEEASRIALTADSTPPSATVATLTSSVARGSAASPAASSPAAADRGESEETTPTKLRRRRLFFTPSRRKSRPTPEDPRIPTRLQQQTMAMPNPISPQRKRPTDTPRPTTQFGSGTPSPLSTTNRQQQQRQRPGRRRRSTGAPVPTSGLSGISTPSSRRRKPLGSSSRKKKYNPLERVSDIFSPRSPDISPSPSPLQSPNTSFDSSYSEASSAGSVKEPFVEQVERLSRLLATPSQQLGDLALTMDDDYGSDDDLDDEMEGLESSRRLLAAELSKVDFSMLRGNTATPGSPERETSTPISPSPQRQGEVVEEDTNWVPLLATEANFPPNFSPAVQGQDENVTTPQSGLSPLAIYTTPDSASNSPTSSRASTIFEGDEFYSPTSTPAESENEEEDEDKKPAAKYSPILDRKKPPPNYPSPDLRKPPPTYPSPERRKPPPDYPSPEKQKSPAKKPSPISAPSQSLSGRGDDNALGELDELMRSLSGEGFGQQQQERRESDFVFDEDKTSQQTKAKATALTTIPSISDPALTEGQERKPSTPSKEEEWDPSDEVSDDGANSPESLLFDPFGLGPRRESTMSSMDSISEFSDAQSTSSSTARNERLIQSFLAFSKRFGDDGRSVSSSVASDLTPNRKMEHSRRILERLNTIFPQAGKEAGKSGKGKSRQQKTKESTSIEKKAKDDDKEIFVTDTRSPSPLHEVIEIPTENLGMSVLSHDSELDQTISQEQEQTPLLEPTLGSDIESSTIQTTTSNLPKNISDTKGSKKLEFEDPPMFIPIFSDDDLDDELVFQKYVPQSRPSNAIVATPAKKQSKPTKRKPTKRKPNAGKDKAGRPKRKRPPSGWVKKKSRNWLLALGILLLVTGVGLIVGTTFFSVDETPAPSPIVTISPTKESKPTPLPSFSPSSVFTTGPPVNTPMPVFFPTPTPTQRPSAVPSDKPSTFPTLVPSLHPSEKPSIMPSDVPTAKPSIMPSSVPSIMPSLLPSVMASSVPSIMPSNVPTERPSIEPSSAPSIMASSVPSIMPSDIPTERPSIEPSSAPSIMPSNDPTAKPSIMPSSVPSIMASSVPSIMPSNAPTKEPSIMPSTMPSTFIPSTVPTEPPSIRPIFNPIISFAVSYKIFIFNGLIEVVPQSEYVPELIRSMDLLTDDILLNINRRTVNGRRIPTEVVLPTSIVDVIDIPCPVDIEGSLCQEVIAEITLINAEDSWEQFRGTTILAIQIGRLQFHLDRVDENSPVEIIDSEWEPPRKSQPGPTDAPLRIPTSFPVLEKPTRPPITIPISQQRLPTGRPTLIPTRSPA